MALGSAWHVLGGGSLGLLCAFHLRRAGFAVNLILRKASDVASFERNGSCIQLLEAWRKDRPGWISSFPVQASIVPCFAEAVLDTQRNQHRTDPPFHEVCPPPGRIRQLVIATKAQDAVPALRNLLPYIDVECRCILLQNGALAVVDQLQQELSRELGLAPPLPTRQDTRPQQGSSGANAIPTDVRSAAGSNRVRLYATSVTHGCYRESPRPPTSPALSTPNGTALGVVHAGLGGITVGPLGPLLAAATHLRSNSSSTSQPPSALYSIDSPAAVALTGHTLTDGDDDDMTFLRELAATVPGLALRPAVDTNALLRELLAKLAANCAINPLTALLGCRNGTLAELPHARRLMRDVCRELVAVFGPTAFPVARHDAAPAQGAVLQHGPEQGSEEAQAELALFEWVLGVVAATAVNRSSMLQDAAAGRPTEVDYLSGWVVNAAAARCTPVPVNATLHALVKAKEGLRHT